DLASVLFLVDVLVQFFCGYEERGVPILALAVVAFVSNRVPIAVIAVGVSLLLFFSGVLTL
ncbi:MAG TPA: hypothetical protein DEB55_13895, partial [Microbacterium sp.]|nr:hypothetical protein [Microbacterium sp.]